MTVHSAQQLLIKELDGRPIMWVFTSTGSNTMANKEAMNQPTALGARQNKIEMVDPLAQVSERAQRQNS